MKDNVALPMDKEKRRDYLERLIMGLEQGIENAKAEIPYYRPEDIQLRYAKKFLAAMEENLKLSRQELAELLKGPEPL